LSQHGIPCDVIVPALIPRRPGDRIKTDRRVAAQLAVLHRAGALTAIHVPTDQEEAARDLLRVGKTSARISCARGIGSPNSSCVMGERFTATKKAWSKRHGTWLRAQTWPLPALDQTHGAYRRAVDGRGAAAGRRAGSAAALGS